MFRKKLCGKKENEGFSLVELIIVMAIMVALIAMIAPNFIGYVQRARDSVVTDSAEEVLHIAKSEYALGNLKCVGSGKGIIKIYSRESDGQIEVELENLEYHSDTEGLDTFRQVCALDENRKAKSDVVWEIEIDPEKYGSMFTFQQTAGEGAGE